MFRIGELASACFCSITYVRTVFTYRNSYCTTACTHMGKSAVRRSSRHVHVCRIKMSVFEYSDFNSTWFKNVITTVYCNILWSVLVLTYAVSETNSTCCTHEHARICAVGVNLYVAIYDTDHTPIGRVHNIIFYNKLYCSTGFKLDRTRSHM